MPPRKLFLGQAPSVYLPLDDHKIYSPPGLSPSASIAGQIASSIANKLPGKRIEDVAPYIVRMRLVKDETEIKALRRAAVISGDGFVAAMRAIHPGVTDRSIAGVMEAVWKAEGSSRA